MIVALPARIPATRPVPLLTFAIIVSLLAQVPPNTKSLSLVVSPSHTNDVPFIGGGGGLITKALVARQPVGNV